MFGKVAEKRCGKGHAIRKIAERSHRDSLDSVWVRLVRAEKGNEREDLQTMPNALSSYNRGEAKK
jgi:hypothetical protein